jgi:hypothetical protein
MHGKHTVKGKSVFKNRPELCGAEITAHHENFVRSYSG